MNRCQRQRDAEFDSEREAYPSLEIARVRDTERPRCTLRIAKVE